VGSYNANYWDARASHSDWTSRGIRVPKVLLNHCGIGDVVELTVHDDRIILAVAIVELKPECAVGHDQGFGAIRGRSTAANEGPTASRRGSG